MTPHVSVHVLVYGHTLCGQVHGVPKDWGPEHRWVGIADWRLHATCNLCREAAELGEKVIVDINRMSQAR